MDLEERRTSQRRDGSAPRRWPFRVVRAVKLRSRCEIRRPKRFPNRPVLAVDHLQQHVYTLGISDRGSLGRRWLRDQWRSRRSEAERGYAGQSGFVPEGTSSNACVPRTGNRHQATLHHCRYPASQRRCAGRRGLAQAIRINSFDLRRRSRRNRGGTTLNPPSRSGRARMAASSECSVSVVQGSTRGVSNRLV